MKSVIITLAPEVKVLGILTGNSAEGVSGSTVYEVNLGGSSRAFFPIEYMNEFDGYLIYDVMNGGIVGGAETKTEALAFSKAYTAPTAILGPEAVFYDRNGKRWSR